MSFGCPQVLNGAQIPDLGRAESSPTHGDFCLGLSAGLATCAARSAAPARSGLCRKPTDTGCHTQTRGRARSDPGGGGEKGYIVRAVNSSHKNTLRGHFGITSGIARLGFQHCQTSREKSCDTPYNPQEYFNPWVIYLCPSRRRTPEQQVLHTGAVRVGFTERL